MRSGGQVNRHLVAAFGRDKLLIRSQGLETKIPTTRKYDDLDVDLLKKERQSHLVLFILEYTCSWLQIPMTPKNVG